jgi:CRISPR-associated protein Cmr6
MTDNVDSGGRIQGFKARRTNRRAPWKLQVPTGGANPHLVARQVFTEDGANRSVLGWFERKGHGDQALHERRSAAIHRLGSPVVPARLHLTVTSNSRLLLGVGDGATASGAGVPLLVPSGVPFIPASALRGVARRSSTLADVEATRLFGTGDAPGVVQITDGLPVGEVRLVEDVLTPHHAKYHGEGKQPSGLDSPVPVPLLAINRGTFETWLVPSAGCTGDDLESAVKALCTALGDEGLGAKTSSGYGYVRAEVKE